MAESFKNWDRVQVLQDRFAKLNNLYVALLDAAGNPVTKISGDADTLSYVIDKVGNFSIFHPAIRELSSSDLEDQMVVTSPIPGFNLTAQSVRHGGRFVGIWAICHITEADRELHGDSVVYVGDDSQLYKALEFLRQITVEFSTLLVDHTRMSAENIRTNTKASNVENTLRRSEANSEVLRLIGSDEPIETIMNRMLQVIGSYMSLSSAQVFKVKESTMDLVSEWLAEGKISVLEKSRGIKRSTLFMGDSILVIGNQTSISNSEKTFLREAHIKSTIIVPIKINNQVSMYMTFNDCDNMRNFSTEDIKLVSNAGQVMQAILASRIQKNSLASSYTALETILDNTGSLVYAVEKSTGAPLFANQIIKSVIGEDLINGKFNEFLSEINTDDEELCVQELEYPFPDGKYWFETYSKSLKWVDGRQANLYVLHDINEKKIYQGRIEQLAYTDFLTGLLNRMCCERDLAAIIDKALEEKTTGALLYIDLDDFKHINDGLGHQYGDVLLQNIAQYFQRIRGIEGHCYRMGGDEFVIIVPPESYHRFELIVEDLKEIFAKPWFLKDADYYCTMSMGTITYPDEGTDVHELIKKADVAMYVAKKGGKNQVAAYSATQDMGSSKRLGLEKSMRDATATGMGEFQVYFQPIIKMNPETKEGECCGAEALVRWNSPTLGFVLPSDFIPLAEYLGLINPIGHHVMVEACKACKNWNDNGHPTYKVNVNLSVVQLLQNDIVDSIKDAINDTGINPANLTLEVTESLAINDMEKMKKILSDIRKIGVRIALDDFGTGYSSLNHIREIPLDVIKIDQTFIKDLATSEYASAFVNMVASLGQAIDVNICVEGIENSDQFEVLKNIPISMIQGYYFDKPLTKEAFENKYV